MLGAGGAKLNVGHPFWLHNPTLSFNIVPNEERIICTFDLSKEHLFYCLDMVESE
jgi:hypothetical protein